MDRYTYRSPFERTCDCGCPLHRNVLRLAYADYRCHCRITCATQPMTVLAPHTEGAFWRDRDGRLWHVPALEPGHWDWSEAAPVDENLDLSPVGPAIALLLSEAGQELSGLIHRRP